MASKVPFVDLGRIHKPLKSDIMNRIESVVDRSAFVLGKEVEDLENEFAKFVGTKHCVAVSSGADALLLGLRALGVGPGHEVITAANTFIATAYAISMTGATPVLADVEEESWNLSARGLDKLIGPKTKAIIPVHLFGQPASMGPIIEIAKSRGIPILEDVAQAHGAKYRGQSCGTFGKAGCFSFYPGKNLGAMGEGGAITTDDEAVRDHARMVRNQGQKEKNRHDVIGGNHRLHTMQAAILLAKLPHLNSYNEQRAALAAKYDKALAGISAIQLPVRASERSHVFHLYVIAMRDPGKRDQLQKFLDSRGIGTGIHYPVPVHLQPCYKQLGKGPGSFPVSERLASSILSLPMFPGMTDDELNTVATAIKEFFT